MKGFIWKLRALSLVAAAVLLVGLSAVWAQDTASVPFLVNVNAAVKATDGATTRQITVTANQEAVLRLPLPKGDGVLYFGTQRQANAPAIITKRSGKVAVNLSAESYKSAEVSLYTVSGKRVLRGKVSAASAANSISRRNIAPGAYLLSVRGTDGNAITSRLTHSGGGLAIDVAFGGKELHANKRLAKEAAVGDWTITVLAAGFVDTVYTLRPTAGTNPRQNITLRESVYEFVVIGGVKWMKKNLDIETEDSWCLGNSPDSCAKYGRLYTWYAAMTACPAGWHLPTREEWDHLAESVGGRKNYVGTTSHNWYDAGMALKSTSGWSYGNGTDAYGFSALPGGYRVSGGSFDGSLVGGGDLGQWWTATEGSRGYVYYRSMASFSDQLSEEDGVTRTWGLSVRCVGDTSNNTTPTTYTLTVERTPTTGGTTTPASSQSNIASGQQVSISATPASGYSFAGWTITSGSGTIANANSASTTVTVNGNVTVRANFTQNSTGGGGSYEFVEMGGLKWMKRNLNVATADSWCYNNSPDSCAKYGRLYTWSAAKAACQSVGWRLPTADDWRELVEAAGGSSVAGKALKSTNGWRWNDDDNVSGNGTDDYGFSALPGGSRDTDDRIGFIFAGDVGYWWTATDFNNATIAYNRDMGAERENVGEFLNIVGLGFSARCVKDD